jgi:hypothetical protein
MQRYKEIPERIEDISDDGYIRKTRNRKWSHELREERIRDIETERI